MHEAIKVHFMRNILAHVLHRDKAEFAGRLKEIWLTPPRRGQERVLRHWLSSMKLSIPKRLKRSRLGWRTLIPSVISRSRMPARSPQPIGWNVSMRRYGGEQGLLVSSQTLTRTCAWSPHFTWSMPMFDRFPEPISAKNPFVPCCLKRLNSLTEYFEIANSP